MGHWKATDHYLSDHKAEMSLHLLARGYFRVPLPPPTLPHHTINGRMSMTFDSEFVNVLGNFKILKESF